MANVVKYPGYSSPLLGTGQPLNLRFLDAKAPGLPAFGKLGLRIPPFLRFVNFFAQAPDPCDQRSSAVRFWFFDHPITRSTGSPDALRSR
jgi:hypothetical protein